MNNKRIGKLRKNLREIGVDSVLVCQPENIYYLSGFDGTTGHLLITKESNILITDFRYEEQAKMQANGFEVLIVTDVINDWLPKLIEGINIKNIGFESYYLNFSKYNQIINTLEENRFHIDLIPLDELLNFQRAIKEVKEIEFITSAVTLADSAINYFIHIVKPGMTEIEIAWKTEKYLREKGSQTLPFNVIVASGPNSSQPHANATNRKIQLGEPILIDLGAKIQSYVSDISRTIILGDPDDTFKRVYEIVLKAQQSAIEGISSGMSGKQADSLARKIIEDSGYGDRFGHSLGHGLGLSVHEEPYLRQNYKKKLVNKMVITIEPGIYIPGWGGIRLEDTAILENGKIKVLSHAEKYDFGGFYC
jgi:Xaa-Pro aminopeptidase